MSKATETKFITVGGSVSTGATPLIDLLREYRELKVHDWEFRIGEAGLFELIINLYEGVSVSDDNIMDWEQETLRYGKEFNKASSLLISVLSRLPGSLSSKIYSIRKYRNQFRSYDSRIPIYSKATKELFSSLADVNSKLGNLGTEARKRIVLGYIEHYFLSLINCLQKNPDERILVFDQTITPKKLFDSKKNISLARAMPFAKIIFVTRDPRDQFCDIVKRKENSFYFFPQKDRANKFVEKYTVRYSKMSDMMPYLPSNVKKVQFEDLVNNYDSTKVSIEEFLGISDQYQFKKYFNPEEGKKSVGIHRHHSNQDEVRYIEKHMGSWLYDSK